MSAPSFETQLKEERGRSHHNEDIGRGEDLRPPASASPNGFYGHIGNPGVLGLAAHGVTLMLLGTQFMGWRGVTAPQVYVGNLWFFAGLYMFTTAQWCLVKGETFAYCVFGVFSGFYLSYGAILTPAFGVADAYAGAVGTATSTATEYQSLATFLFVWNAAFTIIFLASLRTNIALAIVFMGVFVGGTSSPLPDRLSSCLSPINLALLLLVFCLAGMYVELATIAEAAGHGSTSRALALSKAGGAFLFVSACSGFYLVVVQLFESVDFPFTLPVGDLAPYWPKKKTA